MNRFRVLATSGGVAAFLALIAVAWACNPQFHQMTTFSTVYYPTGSTSVLIEGYCDTSGTQPCAGNSDMNLYQDTVSSLRLKELANNSNWAQSDCTSSDTDIGNLKYLANGKSFTNDGTASAVTTTPGNFVLCAGMDTAKLWDNIIVL